MSYTYLQEQGGVSSAACFSDMPASVLSRLNLIQGPSSCSGNEMESCQSSPYGMTLRRSTETRGGVELTSYVADSHARTLVQQEKALALQEKNLDYGEKCGGSFAKYDQLSHSWKTAQCLLFGDLEPFSETWPRWGTMQHGECSEVITSESLCVEIECLFWPAPTCEGWGSEGAQNQLLNLIQAGIITLEIAERMMRRHFRTCVTEPSLEFWWRDGVKLNLNFYEHLMGWPHTWTDISPLAMDKFQQWQRLHGAFCQKEDRHDED